MVDFGKCARVCVGFICSVGNFGLCVFAEFVLLLEYEKLLLEGVDML
jgi:hypothetical protein